MRSPYPPFAIERRGACRPIVSTRSYIPTHDMASICGVYRSAPNSGGSATMRRSHGLLGRLCSIFFASPLFWCRRTSVGSTRIFLAQVGSRDWQSRAFATVCDGGATWLHRCDRVALDGRSALLGTQHPTTCCGLRPLGPPSGWRLHPGSHKGLAGLEQNTNR